MEIGGIVKVKRSWAGAATWCLAAGLPLCLLSFFAGRTAHADSGDAHRAAVDSVQELIDLARHGDERAAIFLMEIAEDSVETLCSLPPSPVRDRAISRVRALSSK